MGWIDVKEELPPDCEHVLVFVRLVDNCTVAYLMYDSQGKPIVYVIVDFDEFEQHIVLDDVTYWHYLPKLPKTEPRKQRNCLPDEFSSTPRINKTV